MSNFVLKIIALIAMLCDHSGYIIFGKFSFMNYIGRLAFPIFAFLISEGYIHTKNLKKYFLRLFIFACITQIPYILFLHTFSNDSNLNILFTLTLGLLAIILYDKQNNKYLGLFWVIFCSIIAQFFYFDYGWYGIAIIFIFYIFKKEKLYMNIFFSIITFIRYFFTFAKTSRIEYIFIIFFCILSLIPINLYNEKKGKNIKYLFYIFYPLHLLILYLIHLI